MSNSKIQNLPPGKNKLLHVASPTESGSIRKHFTIDAEDCVLMFHAVSMTGTMTVKLYEYIGHIDEGKSNLLQDFGTLDGSDTGAIINRKAGASAKQLYVDITYTDACEYEVWVTGAAQGEISVRSLGANAGRNSQLTLADGVVTNIIPAALTGRAGVVIFNNSATTTFYWGYTVAETTVAEGYPILPQMPLGVDMAAGATIYAIADGGTVDLRISEASS